VQQEEAGKRILMEEKERWGMREGKIGGALHFMVRNNSGIEKEEDKIRLIMVIEEVSNPKKRRKEIKLIMMINMSKSRMKNKTKRKKKNLYC